MPDIKVNIRFDVQGTDKFQGAFSRPVRDVVTLEKEFRKVAGAVGKVVVAGKEIKVSPDIKQAASFASKYLASLIKAKGLTGSAGALTYKGIQANVGKNEIGQWGMKGKNTLRTASPLGGQSQAKFAENLRMYIDKTYKGVLLTFQTALKKIPSEVDSNGFATSMGKEIRHSQALILGEYRKAIQSTEGMTAQTGNNIRQIIKELHTKITGGISTFVGKAATAQAGAENIGSKLKDFRSRLTSEVESISKVFGGKTPASVQKLAADYSKFMSDKEAAINIERKAGTLSRAQANEMLDLLKAEHSRKMTAIKMTASYEIASRKAMAKGAAIDSKVSTMFQDSLQKVFANIATKTTGVKIDPAMANKAGQELNAKFLAFEREMVVVFDKLKAEAGGMATATVQADMKNKIKVGLAKITEPFLAMVSGLKTSQTIGGQLAQEFSKLRYNIVNKVKEASGQFSGAVPVEMKALKAKFGAWLGKVQDGIARLSSQGRLTKSMAVKLEAIVNNAYGNAIKGIANIAKTAKAAENKALAEVNKAASEQIAFEKAIVVAKKNTTNTITDMIRGQIRSLKIEGATANMLKKPGINKMISKLQMFLQEMTAAIDKAAPKTRKQLEDMMRGIVEKSRGGIAGMKVERKQDPASVLGNFMFNRATIQSFAAVIGHMMGQIGQEITKFAQSTRLRGQLTNGISDMFMSAFMTSKFLIFREIAVIAGGVVEIFINGLTEIPRQAMMFVGSFMSAIGGALKAGALTSTGLMMAAMAGIITAPMTMGISAAVVLITGFVLTVKALLEGVGNFISSFLKSLFTVIYSIIKAGVMIIASIIKSFAEVISASFKSIFEGIKQATIKFVDFMKSAFSGLVEFMKMAVQEFAGQTEYATRAYKETVGVVGQSLQQFQGLMSSLRAGFGFKREDVGEAVFDVVSSGYRNIADAYKITASAARLAISSESDLATATNAMITAFQNFNMQGETVETIMRTIAAATTLGRMTMQELGGSMKSVMGLASKVNMSFKDTMVSLSMMTRVFGRGSIEEGTRYFNRFLEAIYMPSSRASKSVAELGVNVEKLGKGSMQQGIYAIVDKLKDLELKDVRKIFTTIQSRRAWLGLTKDVEQFKQMFSDVKTVAMGVDWQLEQMMNTPSRLLGRLTQAFDVFKVSVGEQLWAIIVDGIKSMVVWTEKMLALLQSDRIRKFFSAFVEWVTPIVNTVFKPILGFLDQIYMYLNRGFGKGNDFSKIFQTEMAMRLQKTIINVVENVKSLAMWFVKIVTQSDLIVGAWKKVKGIIGKTFKYFESSSWKDWLSDVLNIGFKIKDMISDIFTGTDIQWFQKVVDEIFKVIVKGIQMVGKILQLTLMPVFDRMMALVGVKLKNTLIRGFLDAIDLMASKMSNVGMFSGVSAQLKKIVMDTKMAFGGKRKLQYEVVNSNAKGGWGKVAGGIGDIGGGVSGGGIIGLVKALNGVLTTAEGVNSVLEKSASLSVMTRGMLPIENKAQSEQLDEIIEKYAPTIIDAINRIPKNVKLEGSGKYDFNKNIESFRVELGKLLTSGGFSKEYMGAKGEGTDKAIRQAFDSMVTQLLNFASPAFRKQTGISDESYEASGLRDLLNVFTMVTDDYNDRLESLNYVNKNLANAIPKVNDELIAFGKQLGMSRKEIQSLLATQYKGIKGPFKPEQFQNVVTGSIPKTMEAQGTLKRYKGLEAESKRNEAQQIIKTNNINNALIGKILDVLGVVERDGFKMPEFTTSKGIEKFKEGLQPGQNFATEFMKKLSAYGGGAAPYDVVKEIAGSIRGNELMPNSSKEPPYVREMNDELTALKNRAEEIKKKMDEMVAKRGDPKEMKKKAEAEQAKNFEELIKGKSNDELQNAFNNLQNQYKKLTGKKLEFFGTTALGGGSDKWMKKYFAIQGEVLKREPEYEKYKKSSLSPLNFADWQKETYGNVVRQSEADMYFNEGQKRNKGGKKVWDMEDKMEAIKEEAEYRNKQTKIREETKKNVEKAVGPKAKEAAALEGEKKLRDLKTSRLTDELKAVEDKIAKDTATGRGVMPEDRKRQEAIKKQLDAVKKQEAEAKLIEDEKKLKVERETKAADANVAMIAVKDTVVQQLAETKQIRDIATKQAANVKTLVTQVGNVGAFMTTPYSNVKPSFNKWFIDTVQNVV